MCATKCVFYENHQDDQFLIPLFYWEMILPYLSGVFCLVVEDNIINLSFGHFSSPWHFLVSNSPQRNQPISGQFYFLTICRTSSLKGRSLKRSQKNLMEMRQRKKCRKLLENHFADLFYFLVKGRNIPPDHSLYQKFRLAMEQIPIIGQTITSLHLLGFSVFYCSTFLIQTKKSRNISSWLFQNLSGKTVLSPCKANTLLNYSKIFQMLD